MSVFIKGFDKPKNCRVCDFNSSDCFCKINHGKIDRDFWDCGKECPIVEVPAPHGRLIDADALIARMESDAEQMEEPIAQMFTYAAISDVKHSETVIEAEDGDAE